MARNSASVDPFRRCNSDCTRRISASSTRQGLSAKPRQTFRKIMLDLIGGERRNLMQIKHHLLCCNWPTLPIGENRAGMWPLELGAGGPAIGDPCTGPRNRFQGAWNKMSDLKTTATLVRLSGEVTVSSAARGKAELLAAMASDGEIHVDLQQVEDMDLSGHAVVRGGGP